MQFGVVLLFCLFILCVSRCVETPLRLLKLDIGHVAALSLLLLALNAFAIQPIQEMIFNPASLLLCALSCIWSLKKGGSVRTLQAVVSAIASSLLMLLLSRLPLPEPGLFLACCCLPFVLLLRTAPPAAFFTATLAPMLLCVYHTALELHAYGYSILELTSTTGFDAQVAGLLLTGGLLSLYQYRAAKRLTYNS